MIVIRLLFWKYLERKTKLSTTIKETILKIYHQNIKKRNQTWTGVAFAYPPIVIGTENSAMNTGKVPRRPGKTKSNNDHNSLRLFCIGVPVRISLWGVSNWNREKQHKFIYGWQYDKSVYIMIHYLVLFYAKLRTEVRI